MTVTVFTAIYYLLTYTGLYFLIHVGVCESHQHSVGPRLICKSKFGNNRLVMVCVIEAAYMFFFLAVYSPGNKILYR